MKNRGFFDPSSPTAQHYEPVLGYLYVHGSFGVLAMLLGVFQLSNRLRARYLKPHRALGDTGIEMVVWSTIALAAFLPNILLDWRAIVTRPATKQTMATALE